MTSKQRPVRSGRVVNAVLVVSAVLVWAAVVATREVATSGEFEARQGHLLPEFHAERVNAVRLEAASEQIALQRKPRTPAALEGKAIEDETETSDKELQWVQVERPEVDIEVAQVDELLRAIRFATFIRRIEAEDVNRAGWGLEHPAAVVTLRSAQRTVVLRLGNDAPTPPGAKYLEVSGLGAPTDGIYVVSANTARALSIKPEVLRVRQLVPYVGNQLQALELTRGDVRLRLERAGTDEFRFRGAFGDARVARDALDRLMLALSRTRAEPFVELEQAHALLGANAVGVALTPQDSKQPAARFRFGGQCPGDTSKVIAVREAPSPAAGCVPPVALGEALASPDALLDRGLFRLRSDEVEGYRIERGAAALDVARDGDGFVMRAPLNARVDREAGQPRLDALLAVRGEIQLEPPKVDGAPHRVVVLTSAAATDADVATDRVELWQASPDVVWAHRIGDGAWLRVQPSALRALSVDSLLVRERQLLDVPDSDVRRVEVTWSGKHQTLVQEQRGEFVLSAPLAARADGALAVALVDAVRSLTVDAWVAESDDGSFGFARPTAEVRIDVAGGTSRVFVVGARAGLASYYAMERGAAGVFTLRRSWVDTCTTLLVDRSGFMLEAGQIDELTVASGEHALGFKRVGSEFVQVAGGYQLPLNKLATLIELLGTLRPDAAVALEADGGRYGFDKPVIRLSAKLSDGTRRGFSVGIADVVNDQAVHYARLDGSSVVFVLPRALVTGLLDAL